MPFRDRVDAGRRLAGLLADRSEQHVVVLGIPRGGVPVAAEVARALGAPLDVIVVRKLGVPQQPELAMGAIGEGGVRVVNDDVVVPLGIGERTLADVEARERDELRRRARRFRGERAHLSLSGRTAVIVDDGIATGSTAAAACQVARAQGAERVVLAAPVSSPDAARALRAVADDVVTLEQPVQLRSVGEWYVDFTPTSDDEVVRLLDQVPSTDAVTAPVDRDVAIPVGSLSLSGRLTVPEGARAVVVFAHGSGSSRHSPRNQFVAELLRHAGLGTLLFDLLSPAEERDRGAVFDIELLGARLAATTRWLEAQPDVGSLPVAYFGASTGAAAALWAAADADSPVVAVVSRGGRPDLAHPRLPAVRAPTLLIVGSRDEAVLDLNRQAADELTCAHQVSVIPGATHLFEEPGTLQAAALAARDWILAHVG